MRGYPGANDYYDALPLLYHVYLRPAAVQVTEINSSFSACAPHIYSNTFKINAMYRQPVQEAKYTGTSSINIGKTGRLQSIQILSPHWRSNVITSQQ